MIADIGKSGIQKKYLKYTLLLLMLALLLSSAGVWVYVEKSIEKTKAEKYMLITEQMGDYIDSLFKKSDEVMFNFIFNEEVQKSLYREGITLMERNALIKCISYVDLDNMEDYFYVDNNNNVYVRSYKNISYKHFIESRFQNKLGTEYSKTKWIWAEDTLFDTGEMSLFIGRYIRNVEYSRRPGMLFYKMNDSFLKNIVNGEKNIEKGVIAGILDSEGNNCFVYPDDAGGVDTDRLSAAIIELVDKEGSGMVAENRKLFGGILSVYFHRESGMVVYTFVPQKILIDELKDLLLVLSVLYIFVALIAFNISLYISKHLSKPIMLIANSMSEFNGKDFKRLKIPKTNTEIDQIGIYYNQMQGNVEKLLCEIKVQEESLRRSELNMLISQINPHFIYNTLDTIYMLARINKEETTMHMIQSLSKYLRLSLSKGNDIVTLKDELENVKSYMEIQQIRNNKLFEYDIEYNLDIEGISVLKLLLQPLVENSIKYGFGEIYEGGIIRIYVGEDEKYLILSVYNNGKGIEPDTLVRLNRLQTCSIQRMQEIFPDKEHGYGVVNVATRLRLKYGDDIGFFYKNEKEGTSCTIKIPKEED